MKIYFEEGQAVTQEILDTMMQAAEYCLDAEQIDTERSEISVTFVSLEEIHELNREYRQVDSPTDVLSFPQFDDLDELPEEGEIMLGDVVICSDRAKEQAEEFGHSFEREIIYLFVHSVLHLLGYDHMEEDEKRIMRRREEEVMERIGLKREEN
ncbi:MAG: rRNA maturation RNase YbeY [Anaerovoracaceae bacterium]|nr:rRNA maturation RNase YbeY [Anaerovoracaceae bacterium]